jgi:excisionase family DNA binding protein
MPSPFWNIEDVMEYLQIRSRTTLYKLIEDGLPYAKIGKKLIFRQKDIDGFLETQFMKKASRRRNRSETS